MQIGDLTFFAPNIPFEDIDLTGRHLPDQILARIEGYYLEPAGLCVQAGHAFGAGLLVVTSIDAASRFAHGPNRIKRNTGRDFTTYARTRLPSFGTQEAAEMLYDNYRNGLVHEARLKEGCQFSLDIGRTLSTSGRFPVIDAQYLLNEVRGSIHQLVEEMREDEQFQNEVVAYIRQTFASELARTHR